MKLLSLAVAISLAASAQPKKAPAQHAHSHGTAKINIGVEGQTGTIEFEAAADPIVGFEHKPKSAAEQKSLDTALATLKSRANQLVLIPAAYGCAITPSKAELEIDGSHAEVHAEFNFKCAKPLKGAELKFGVSKLYPEIQEVQVQAVSDAGQTGATIRNNAGSVKIG